MGYQVTAGAAVALASALSMAALGVAVLRVRPRSFVSVSFAAFVTLWGAGATAGNLVRMATDPGTSYAWMLVMVALFIPLYIPLGIFLLFQMDGRPARFLRPLPITALLAPAVFLTLLLAAAPDLFVERASVGTLGALVPVPGPLFTPVLGLNAVLALVAASGVLAWRLGRETAPRRRAHLALLASAFLSFVAFRVSTVTVQVLIEPASFVGRQAPLGATVFALIPLTGVPLVAVVTWWAARDPSLPHRDLLLTLTVLPFAVGIAEASLRANGRLAFDTIGIWRLVMVGLFAYAIARHRMLDIDLRLNRIVPPIAYALALTVGLALLVGFLGGRLGDQPLFAATAVLGLAAVCWPVPRLVRDRVMDVREETAAEHRARREHELYTTALEEARSRGADATQLGVILTDLRDELGVLPERHRSLVADLVEAEDAPFRPASVLETRYNVVRELGRGSFGVALLARDMLLQRDVVLKRPLAPMPRGSPQRETFLEEARLAARIQHPNLVTVYEVEEAEDPPLTVLEFVEGGSLRQRLRQQGALDPAEALERTRDLLEGLDRVHQAGIVHRDLKPANVLIDRQGQAKITDFGVALGGVRSGGGGGGPDGDVEATAVGVMGAGTLAYMAPEQVLGGEATEASDLYAAAALAVECFTGRHYLDIAAASPADARRRILEAAPSLEAVPEAVRPVLARALAKDPRERFPAARAMLDALPRGL